MPCLWIAIRLKLTDALLLEKTPDHYMLVLAVKGKDKQQPWTKALADAFRAPEFKAVLEQKFPGYARPAFLQ